MESLLSLSLIGSVLGILIISFLATNLEPNMKDIVEIDERNLEEVVKIQGKITFIREYENLVVFTLDDETGKIDCVFYESIILEKNQAIEVIGKVIEYKGKIEIEANKIKFLET